MANKGYIKLYRDIEDSVLWASDEPFNKRDAWIDLLLMVNHTEKDVIVGNHSLTVQKGEKFTSIRKLSQRWHWNKDKTLAYLRLLEDLGMIRRCKTLNGTLLTIVNYGKTQDRQDTIQDTNPYTYRDTIRDTYQDTTTPQTIMNKNDIRMNKERKKRAQLNSFGFPIED